MQKGPAPGEQGPSPVAVTEGFEPSLALTPNIISSDAPSAARTRHQLAVLYRLACSTAKTRRAGGIRARRSGVVPRSGGDAATVLREEVEEQP